MISKMGKGAEVGCQSVQNLNQLLSQRWKMAGHLLAPEPAVEGRVQRMLEGIGSGVGSPSGDSGLTLQDQEVGEKWRWDPGH